MSDKPLFVPLKREYYRRIFYGEKHEEYRLYGARWNERTITPGRHTMFSLGYGKTCRVILKIKRVWIQPKCTHPDFVACYGEGLTAIIFDW